MSLPTDTEGNVKYEKIKFAALRQCAIERMKNQPKLIIGGAEFDFDFGDLSDFYLQKAKTELREIPENVEKGLAELKKLVEGEPNLYVSDDDEFFAIFLRSCKWYAQSAFSQMKRFYRFKQNYPHIYRNLIPSKEKTAIDCALLYPLPLRNHDGARIILIHGGRKWKPKQVSLEQIFKAMILCTSAAMMELKTQISGVHVIIDMEGLSLNQVTYFTPSFAKMTADYVQNCLPIRLKTINVINQPFLFNMVFALFKPFLEEKLRKRIFFHGTNRESLLSIFDKNTLYSEYGGTLVSSENDIVGEMLWKMFISFDDLFEVNNSFGYKTVDNKK